MLMKPDNIKPTRERSDSHMVGMDFKLPTPSVRIKEIANEIVEANGLSGHKFESKLEADFATLNISLMATIQFLDEEYDKVNNA